MLSKKSLALTTALSAVGMLTAHAAVAAEKPKLKISGYQETYFGVADVNTGTTSSGTPTYKGGIVDGAATLLQYGEIRFLATGVTDSGMKWGVYFESTQDDASGTGNKAKGGSDEANLFLQGSWGKLEIGGQDGASDVMQVSAFKFDLLDKEILPAFVKNTGDALKGFDTDDIIDSSDDSKFTYYSPRVSGFQAGVSYAPSIGTIGSVPTGSTSGEIESGVSYQGKSGSTKFEVAANYSQIGKSATGKTKDGYKVGGTVGFGAISVGAGYTKNNNWRADNSDQNAWSVGANYNGGKWEVSLIYLDSQLSLDAGGDDKYHQTELQGAYNLGGGLTAAVGLYSFKMDARTSTNDDKGTAAIGKINAKF